MNEPLLSIAPDGRAYGVPTPEATEAEFRTLQAKAEAWRARSAQVVVVQGLGFVGTAMAAVVADAQKADGSPAFHGVGIDLATPSAYWKVARIKEGVSPFPSPDPDMETMLHRAVLEVGNLDATVAEEAYGLADVIVVDIPLDVADRTVCDPTEIRLNLAPFEAAIRAIGRHMRAEALVLVETTVPMGTTEQIVLPILQEAFRQRGLPGSPLLAHAYERVMPGPRYVDSIRRFWRTFAGIDAPSSARAQAFLEAIVETENFPVRALAQPTASELAKLLENSYRAANIAFIHEWTLTAEELGINLFEVVDSIRVRKGTHDNMRYPGFGVGGYCLTKDSLLAQWSLTHAFHNNLRLDVTLEALRINFEMPCHTLSLLKRMLGSFEGRTVAVCGLSYLAEVPDTRNTPTELLVDELQAQGARVLLHDPVTRRWPERPDFPVAENLEACLRQAEGVVLAIPHRAYLDLKPETWLAHLKPGAVVVDAQNILDDARAEALHARGHRLFGVGKGHWRTKGFER
ncbi:MAG TPA: nucleotide sugar dehydrogenase [Holophaga sp.]|nr:nucleotide sugar dehydrogenase [Holophaga sp.]